MPTTRYATPHDAALISSHRYRMFADNSFTTEAALIAADTEFEPWVRKRLEDGRYVGLLLEDMGKVVAGAGMFFADFPPHWMDPQPCRAYILNVFTEPHERGKGYAKRLMEEIIDECRQRNILTVVLHASPQGRPVYERLAFAPTDEMMLRLNA